MTRPGRPSHPDVLTPREEEVLALLREGLTNPQIAERLSITLDGAKYHVSEILSKLGVSSREEAARWEPAERPWWATAAVPLAWSWRRANVSWLATGVAGITAVLVVVGAGLLVWGLVRTDSSDGTSVLAGATVSASPTAPLATLTPTTEPTAAPPAPSPSATLVPTLPTAPAEPPATAYPPPLPKPESPTVVETATVTGGEWYEFEECFVFYLPPGYDFVIHVAINDPGGDLTIAFEASGLDSAVVFSESTGTEVGRTVVDPALQPVFDQIASTFDKVC